MITNTVPTLPLFTTAQSTFKHKFTSNQEIIRNDGTPTGIIYLSEAGQDARGNRLITALYPCGNIGEVLLNNILSGNTTKFGGLRQQLIPGMIRLACGEPMYCDLEDWSELSQYNWSKSADGYALTNVKGKNVKAHRLIVSRYKDIVGKDIDHIDGDKLNNCRSNLRVCTRGQNSQNSQLCSRNTSGIKGVSWDKRAGKWRVRIIAEGERHYLGRYTCLLMANIVVCRKRKELHGAFANHGVHLKDQ